MICERKKEFGGDDDLIGGNLSVGSGKMITRLIQLQHQERQSPHTRTPTQEPFIIFITPLVTV